MRLERGTDQKKLFAIKVKIEVIEASILMCFFKQIYISLSHSLSLSP